MNFDIRNARLEDAPVLADLVSEPGYEASARTITDRLRLLFAEVEKIDVSGFKT